MLGESGVAWRLLEACSRKRHRSRPPSSPSCRRVRPKGGPGADGPAGPSVQTGLLRVERFPPTWKSSTPDPVTAWMAVAGSGVSPRQATFEARARPAGRYRRRLPPDRTSASIRILGEQTSVRDGADWSCGAAVSPVASRRSASTVRCPSRIMHSLRRSSRRPFARDAVRAKEHQSRPVRPTIPSC